MSANKKKSGGIRFGISKKLLVSVILLTVLICVISTLLVVNRVAYISRDDLYY